MSQISDRLEEQATLLFKNVAGWETNALRRIGWRVKSIKSLSYADLQALNNASLVKQDVDAILEELAKLTNQNVAQVKKIYAQMIEEQHIENKRLYDYRNKPFVPFADNRELQAIVNAYARTTAETMVNLSMTKARQLGFVDKNNRFVPIEKNFNQVLDKAVMSITTGTGDFGSEMRDVLKELGDSGLRVDYGGGITRRLDSMVRQNLLWGAKQASVEYNEMIGEELGCDGIEIDWHSNPRPSHEFMQGKQYSLYGKKTIKGVTYERADDALRALSDYGCLHFKTPIILGVSEPAYSPKELARLNAENSKQIEINGTKKTGWEWKQDMRALERGARNTKDQIEILKASGDNSEAKRLKTRLSAIEDRYNQIAQGSGIKAQPQRMSIIKGKTVDKSVNSGIIEMNRQAKNIGVFAELQEYMSKKHIRRVATECGIDLKGLTLNIDKNEELLRTFLAGRADYENIGQITFFPNAFKNREELVRTIYHEKIHVEQYKKYGVEFVQNNNVRFEEEAYIKEEEFIKNLKERGIL